MRLSILAALCVSVGIMAIAPAFAADDAKKDETPSVTIWRGDESLREAEDLMAQNKFSEALTLLDLAISRNMRNTDAHVDSAIAWMTLGNLDKAKISINNAIAIDRGHLGAYVIAGEIALKEDNAQQAEYYLGALKVLCRGENCPEFHALQKMIREKK